MNNSNTNKKVLFIGSFQSISKDGSVGGQMFACTTLINSKLSNAIEWTLIDSTSDSNLLSPFYIRLSKALRRVIKFIFHLIFSRFDAILIFSGNGLSFVEKGLMALLGKLTRSKVILAPRSGIILSDIEKSTLFRNFVIFVLRNVDIVICQASFWQDKLMTISKSKNINKFKIIENWIEVEQYLKLPTVKKDKNELTRILFLSWLDRNKGVYELIESVRILIAQGLNIELILAGRGADFDDVNLLIDHLKLSHYIKAKGWVLGDEKLKLFNDSDVFVLPSYYEGYPNSLIEAMASAKCCIATKVGAIPNIIDNGVNGLTIDPVNIVQLTDAIRKVTEEPDLRYRFGIQARADVLQKNTCDVAVSKFLDLLE